MSPATAPTTLRNPFPGLRPFRQNEEHLFFGRESKVDAMVDKLAATRFLTVVGTSGSGKSSLVNCGLLPALHRGLMASAGSAWRVAQFRPGLDPLHSLAGVLATDGVLYSRNKEAVPLEEIVETYLRRSTKGLVDTFRKARLPAAVNLLVVVDQFEELFRYRKLGAAEGDQYGTSEESIVFVNLLMEAQAQRDFPIYVVVTMRSDFLGDCSQFHGLPEAINQGQYLVPRMTREERRASILGPVGVGGAKISPVLLTRLVNDVGDNADQLSLLQHALNRTWACWESQGAKGEIELEHYEEIGTMAHALNRHANEAYAELGSPRMEKICEKIFKALTDMGTDPRGIRRPTKLGTLCEIAGGSSEEPDVKAVIDVFRDPSRSFLLPPMPEPLDLKKVIDISHESLMRLWERLRLWAEEEAQSARCYRRLAETAVLEKSGKARLWSDPDLQMALDWQAEQVPTAAWASFYGGDFESAIAFLEKSRHRRDHELAEAVLERRWRNRWKLIIVTLLVGVFLWRFAAGDFDRWSEVFGFRKSEVKQSVELAEDELRNPTSKSWDKLVLSAQNTGAGLLTLSCFFGPYFLGYFALAYSGKWIYRRVTFAGILKEIRVSTNKAVREERLAREAAGDAAVALKTTYANFARRCGAYILDYSILYAGSVVFAVGTFSDHRRERQCPLGHCYLSIRSLVAL